MARFVNTTENYNFENTTDLFSFYVNQTQPDSLTLLFVNFAYLYYTPILILFGTVGNLMSVFVFFKSHLRYQPTSQYLSALAISDTVFLLQLIPPWLSTTQDIDLFYTGGFCQFFVYISYVSSSCSAWLIVVFTFERVLAVKIPLHRSSMCTLTRSRYIIIGFSIASAIVNIPVLQFAAPTSDECSIDRKYFYFATRFNIVDSTISFTVPMGLITFMNVWIIYSSFKFGRNRLKMMQVTESNPVGPRARPRAPYIPPQQYHRAQHRITRMLLIVSTVYVILNLPAYSIRYAAYEFRENAVDIAGKWIVLQKGAALCFYTNFGINFFLYCLNGRNFRQALIQSIPYLRHRAERAEAARLAALDLAPANSISTSLGSNGMELASVVTVQPTRRFESDVIQRWTFNNKRRQSGQPGPSTSTNMNIELYEMDVVRNF